MKFLLEAYVGLREDRYRLQQDNSWRSLPSHLTRNYLVFNPEDNYSSIDRFFSTLNEMKPLSSSLTSISCEQGQYKVHQHGTDYCIPESEPTAFLHPKIKRETKPHRFTKAELKEVIAADTDKYHNTLILTLDGYFELWSPKDAQKLYSPIAVRHESFVAGNDYVGKQAALDNGFINQTYLTMLEGWVTHLMNFELDVYQDDYDGKKTESQLWAEVENLTKHLH